jgi:hypothetical protein
MPQLNAELFLTSENESELLHTIGNIISVDGEIMSRIDVEDPAALSELFEQRKMCITQLDQIHAQLIQREGTSYHIRNDNVKEALVRLHLSSTQIQEMIDKKSKTVLTVLQQLHKQRFYNH